MIYSAYVGIVCCWST